jgi:hypothetical protein
MNATIINIFSKKFKTVSSSQHKQQEQCNIVSEWVSDCCLTPIHQFFSYIILTVLNFFENIFIIVAFIQQSLAEGKQYNCNMYACTCNLLVAYFFYDTLLYSYFIITLFARLYIRVRGKYLQIHDRWLTCLGTGTLRNSEGVKLVLWAYTSPLSEMMRLCKYFPRTLTYNRVNSVIMK